MNKGAIMKIIGIFITFISSFSFADTIKGPDEAKVLSEKMIAHFTRKEFQQGLALAKPYWPMPSVEIDGLASQISTQWPIVDQRFGGKQRQRIRP